MYCTRYCTQNRNYLNEGKPVKMGTNLQKCKYKKYINMISCMGKANLSHWKSSQNIIFTYLDDKENKLAYYGSSKVLK